MAEAPKFSGFYKLVQPASEPTTMYDNQPLDGDGAYGNYSWYQQVIQGSGSRMTRYREYDVMDSDVDIARALDTIAEEICGLDEVADQPIKIDIITDDASTLSDTEVMTLRAAARYWVKTTKLKTRLYNIVRNTIKYGDCFFIKQKENSTKWEHIHSKHVVGAIVAKDDITNIIGWQMRNSTKEARNSYGTPLNYGSQGTEGTVAVPSKHVIRFTLMDDMSDAAPFGESILRSVYRSYKQKELLEDAIIIYRIQRAPERRVFYIDVGKMPPQRTKQYLEQIKNDIKQKKIPTINGGANEVDSVYNPQSMSEDFFFAQKADGKGSRVETLPGGQGLGELADLEYFMKKVIRGLRIPYSYMYQDEQQGGGIFNDGRAGVAYIQELRFALYVQRLQAHFEEVLDEEFKTYLRLNDIRISQDDWTIKLPPPQNFGKYRQQELDAALLNGFQQADGVQYLSKRFILERYLQLDTEEIIRNEALLREEKNMPADENNIDDQLRSLYRPEEDMMADDMGGDMGDQPMAGGGGLDEPGAAAGGEEPTAGGEEAQPPA